MHISFFGLLPHILFHSIVEQSFMGFYLIHAGVHSLSTSVLNVLNYEP